MTPTIDAPPRRLAAPAPVDREPADDAEMPDRDHLHAFSEGWAAWARSRRMYGAPRYAKASLNKLAARAGLGPVADGPDAPCSAEYAAFQIAVIAQPESLSRIVFELHYHWRVRNVKAAARELGIGRQHWYTLLRQFRERAWAASRIVLSYEAAKRRALGVREAEDVLVD
ncbi:MAG: hypothetical protein L6Q68_02385 [Aquabacterium sp.]|nr:hypothetical protein [Aquabacterium sp.]